MSRDLKKILFMLFRHGKNISLTENSVSNQGIYFERFNAVALLIYVILALCIVEIWHSGGGKVLGTGDAPTFVWYFKWWPWALIHHRDPLMTNLVWYPSGEDLAWATSIPAIGLIAAPLTLMSGPVLAFNVCSLLAPALAAWTAFLLFKKITNDNGAALIGGYFFGFSSYEVAQMLGHLNLDTIFVVPVLVLLVFMRVNDVIPKFWFLVLLSTFLILQFGISIEVFATASFFGMISVLVVGTFSNDKYRKRILCVVGEIAICFVVTVVAVSPWLLEMWKGRRDIAAQFNSPLMYSNDALNFFIPTDITRFGGRDAHNISRNFAGNISEQGAYIGIFLIIILISYFVRYWKKGGTRVIFGLMLMLMICSLGPQLQINGRHTGIPLPWWIGMHLPLIRQALPARFSMYISLLVGLVVALWLASAECRLSKVFRLSIAMIAAISLLPNPSVLRWSKVATPPFFKGGEINRVLGSRPNVIILPYAYFAPGMLWQAKSDMAFTQSGGYLGYVPRQFAIYRWPIIGDLLNGTPAPSFERDLTSFCRAHHVTAVLVTPEAPAALVHAMATLAWHSFRSGGVEVFRVPAKKAR